MSLGRFWYPLIAVVLLTLSGTMTTKAAAQTSAQLPTTGTLVLRAGDKPGEFRIGEKMILRTRILRPDVNRDLNFTPTSPAPGRQTLTSDRGEVRISLVDPKTFAAEFSVKKGTNGIAIIEVLTADAPSSPVINWNRNSVTAHDGTALVIIQVEGVKVLRSNIQDGVRIVAPLRPGETVRLTVGREELSDEAFRLINLSSLPAAQDPLRNEETNNRTSALRGEDSDRQSASISAPASAYAQFRLSRSG